MANSNSYQKSSFTRDGKYYAENAEDIAMLDNIQSEEREARRLERQRNIYYATRILRQQQQEAVALERAILRGEAIRRLAVEKAREEREETAKAEQELELKVLAARSPPKEPAIFTMKDIRTMNPKDMKLALSSRGLSKQGNRHELLKRLRDYESKREAKRTIGHSSKHVFSTFMRSLSSEVGFEESKDVSL